MHITAEKVLSYSIHIILYFLDDEEEEPGDDIKDMSPQSAEICIVKAFNVHSIHFLTFKKYLLPLGKALSVKCRSLGKCQRRRPL